MVINVQSSDDEVNHRQYGLEEIITLVLRSAKCCVEYWMESRNLNITIGNAMIIIDGDFEGYGFVNRIAKTLGNLDFRKFINNTNN